MSTATHTRQSSRETRLARLLDTIRALGGRWTPSRVQDLRRATGEAPCRTTARHDLLTLARRGHLHAHGADNSRHFTLPQKTRRNISHKAAAAALRAQPGVWLPIGEYRNRGSAKDVARRIQSGSPLGDQRYGTPYVPTSQFDARLRLTDDGTLLEARYTPKGGQP